MAYTDVVQLGFIFIGLWVAIPFAARHPSVGSISTTWPEWRGNIKKSQIVGWIDSMLLLVLGGIPWQVTNKALIIFVEAQQKSYFFAVNK